MADELIDIFDEKNKPLGIQKMKSEAHRDGLWHRTSHVWIYNSRGEIFLQFRANTKDWPNMWDISAAGHINAGEDTLTAALRETEEEIGLKLKPDDLEFFKIHNLRMAYNEKRNNEHAYVYFFKFDGDINDLKMQKEEVAKIKFIPVAELTEDLKLHPLKYVPHGDYWDEVIEEVRNRILDL
ncbi:MAG: NUDIX domain-containing protein [bacterium]